MSQPPVAKAARTFFLESNTKVVGFRLGDSFYAVDVRDVDGVYHGLPLIPAAIVNGSATGYIQLSQARVPVLNMRQFMGLPALESREVLNWVVVLRQGNKQIALDVEAVDRVVKLSPAHVAPLNGRHAAIGVRAVAHAGGQDYYLIDTEFLFSETIH